jgi:hypothetical protein
VGEHPFLTHFSHLPPHFCGVGWKGAEMGKLTAKEVTAALAKPGQYGDGDGLFLKVDKRGGAY